LPEKRKRMSETTAMEIGSDLWNARVFAGLSVASELAARLDRPKLAAFSLLSAWQIYWKFGRLNRDLDEIFKEYDRPATLPPELPPEMLQEGRDILLKLYADCKRLESPLDGFPLHQLINRRLARLQMQSERILDLADWFDAMSNPEETNAKFDAALADLARGDVIPWTAVQ
jgi:hypothetical protein